MKKVQKRILTVIVSLTITGSGIATYLRYSGNSFDPEKYTRNSAWNRNQITFDDDQTDDEYMNSEKQDDTTEDSRQLEQDDNADQAQTPSEQRDNAILFESQTPQNLNVPALITQDTDGGSGDGAAVSPQQASQNVTSYLVGDRSGSASGPVAVIPSASGSGTVISGGTSGNSGTAGKDDQNGKGNAGGTSGTETIPAAARITAAVRRTRLEQIHSRSSPPHRPMTTITRKKRRNSPAIFMKTC